MCELRQTGLGFDKIASTLNSEGLKPRAGERCHGVVINRILADAEKKAPVGFSKQRRSYVKLQSRLAGFSPWSCFKLAQADHAALKKPKT
jgi:hypothetical protein